MISYELTTSWTNDRIIQISHAAFAMLQPWQESNWIGREPIGTESNPVSPRARQSIFQLLEPEEVGNDFFVPHVSRAFTSWMDFSTFWSRFRNLDDHWCLSAAATHCRRCSCVVCQALPDWCSWLHERCRRTKGLGVEISFNSFDFYIFVFAVKSMTPFGMTWYRQVSCEGWGRVGSTQQMNLRTAANVRPSLAVTVYAIMWPDC